MSEAVTHPREIGCCFTGHRPEHLPWGEDESESACEDFRRRLTAAVEAAMETGFRRFYCGMARGVDMMAARIVLRLRDSKDFQGIRLIAVCPFMNQQKAWRGDSRERYGELLAMADEVVYISEGYSPYCFHERNRYMVNHSARLIAGYDGTRKGGTAYTLNYARKQGLQLAVIPPLREPDLLDGVM